MESYDQVVNSLQNRFPPEYRIMLTISHSNMTDLDHREFSELNMNIKALMIPFNGLK
jgi:hypothetical protein